MQPLKRLQELRARIDGLVAPKPRRFSFAFDFDSPRPHPAALYDLDGRLDEVGIFTLADARALAELLKGRDKDLQALGRDLRRKAKRTLREVDARVRWEERSARRRGVTDPDALAALDDLFVRLKRVVLVAQALAHPDQEIDLPSQLLSLPPPARPADDARVAAAQFLLARAQATAFDVAQKRRDLALAHELLLRLGSELERTRVQGLRLAVARARRDLEGLQGLDPLQAIDEALKKGNGSQAWGWARSLYLEALATGDGTLATASRAVLSSLQGGIRGGLETARVQDRAAQLLDTVGSGAISSLMEADKDKGRRDLLGELTNELKADEWAVFELAAGLDGFFDVEGSEEVVTIPGPLQRVSHPAARMEVDLATSINEATQFIVTDPRSIVYDLASGRQLVRAWYEQGVSQQRRRGGVRVYVCDASGSMRGARARFRDAVLIAELNNLTARAAQGKAFSPIYYCFFNIKPSDLGLVDTPEKATSVIRMLLQSSPAKGKTDITLALESAFAAIHQARGRDPQLARATVVLVTDGDNKVDLERIEKARVPFGGLEITLSFISLGVGNEDLTRLVQQQREAAHRAFYYHLTDDEIAAGRTSFETGQRTLLPARPRIDSLDAKALEPALELLKAAAARPRPAGAAPQSRFDSYFLSPKGAPSLVDERVQQRVGNLLHAVGETVAMAPIERRRGEAVELLEHLLRTYRLTSADYLAAVRAGDEFIKARLESLQLLCPLLRQ